MTFDDIQAVCLYQHSAYDIDKQVITACNTPGAIPKGDSWGICDKEHCPIWNKNAYGTKEDK